MADIPITSLEEYKRSCEVLRADINLAIQDYKFKERGKLVYTVDFSEIFSYILLSEEYADFILFPDAFTDEEKADVTALQQIVLRHIFHDLPTEHKLILLSPYILEFRTFIKSLKNNMLDELVTNAVRIFEDLEKIAAQQQDKIIASVCKKIEAGIVISDEDDGILAEFIQNYGHIQSILEEGKSEHHPIQRVKQLNFESVFSPISDLINLGPNIDTTVYDRWVVALGKSRLPQRKSSTELDAASMNLVYEVNRTLEKSTRLILITRSESMHNLYKNEYDGLWKNNVEFHVLRHPRTFLISLAVAQKSSDDIKDLRDLNDTIDLFLRIYESWKQDRSQPNDRLFDLINKIKQDWKQIQKTTLPLGVKSFGGEYKDAKENAKVAKMILEYARSNNKANKKIAERINDLFYNLDRAHEILGLDLHIPNQVRFKEYSDRWELQTPSHLNPYKLNFETRFVKEIMKKLSEEKRRKISIDIASIFARVFDESKKEDGMQDYESILVMAYMLGLLGKWQIADNYCARAISVGESKSISPHEALYFQAICKREGRISENWLLDSLELLDKAIGKSRSQNASESIVARYHIEKGIAILTVSQSIRMVLSQQTIDEGLSIIDEWEKKIEDNIPLKIVILRLKLGYFIASRKYERLKHLKNRFKLIEDSLIRIEKNNSEWSPDVVDVMNWGKWVLFSEEYMDISQRERLILQLNDAKLRVFNRNLKEEIIEHIDDIKKGEPYKFI